MIRKESGPAEADHGFTVIIINAVQAGLRTHSLSSSSLGLDFDTKLRQTQRVSKHGFAVNKYKERKKQDSLSSSSLGLNFDTKLSGPSTKTTQHCCDEYKVALTNNRKLRLFYNLLRWVCVNRNTVGCRPGIKSKHGCTVRIIKQ